MSEAGRWRFWVDRGGTFTDCIGQEPSGAIRVTKVLSSDDAPLRGIRALLGLGPDAPIPPCELRMGTTLGTNALLERRGRACGLAITRGFGDLLEIGDQSRPEIFALPVDKPPPLHRAVLAEVERFQEGRPPDDDLTLILVKRDGHLLSIAEDGARDGNGANGAPA